MNYPLTLLVLVLSISLSPCVLAQKAEAELELETTLIKANKELPQVLYIVPWQDFNAPETQERKLKLHDFFGDLYEPMLAPKPSHTSQTAAE